MACKYNTIEDFFAKVDKDGPIIGDLSPCWLWLGRLDKDGYGVWHYEGDCVRTHRFSYSYWRGNLIKGRVIMHRCDVRNCVNPDHLSQGTTKDNNRDMFRKGRNARMDGTNNPMNKLTEYQVRQIRLFYAAGLSGTELAKTFNVTRRQIYNIVNNLQWKDLEPVKGIAEAGDTDSKVLTNELDGVSIQTG